MARELYALPASPANPLAGGPGWVYVSDSVHTTGSRQAITAGTRTQITIDGLGSDTELSYIDTLPTDIWGSNAINANTVGDAFSTRFQVTFVPTVVAEGYVDIELDIGTGGSPIVILKRTQLLTKGNGIEQPFNAGLPIFTLATFVANGGRLYVTPSINISMFGKALFLNRTFSP